MIIVEGEVNLKISGCEEQNVLFTQKKKKRAQRNLIPLNFRQMEERHMSQD